MYTLYNVHREIQYTLSTDCQLHNIVCLCTIVVVYWHSTHTCTCRHRTPPLKLHPPSSTPYLICIYLSLTREHFFNFFTSQEILINFFLVVSQLTEEHLWKGKVSILTHRADVCRYVFHGGIATVTWRYICIYNTRRGRRQFKASFYIDTKISLSLSLSESTCSVLSGSWILTSALSLLSR